MAFVLGPGDSTDAGARLFFRLRTRLPGAGRAAGQPACVYVWERGTTHPNSQFDLLKRIIFSLFCCFVVSLVLDVYTQAAVAVLGRSPTVPSHYL